MELNEILLAIKETSVNIFSDNLVGVYIHGSIAFGCFNPKNSDIDFIVITKNPPKQEEKTKFILFLLELDKYCPSKGLEFSLVLEEYAKEFVFPTPFELHFSNAHKEKAEKNIDYYCSTMRGNDPDLAAHFAVINKWGIKLCGQDISGIFSPVPREYYLKSIKMDIENALDEIYKNSVYIILNLCRVMAYVQSNEILSKKQGGQWGLINLPKKYKGIIENALLYYTSNRYVLSFDKELCKDFAEYMLNSIM